MFKWKKNQKVEEEVKSKVKEILSLLPATWSELKLKDFLIISSIQNEVDEDLGETFNQANIDFKIISVLSGDSIDELENLTLQDIAQLTNKISFLSKEPVIDKKNKINWKSVEEITYGDLIVFHRYFKGNIDNNIHHIIKSFSKDDLTEDAILQMNMQDLNTGFFFLRLSVRKFIQRSQRSLVKQLKTMGMKKEVKKLLYKIS
ncbi:MAG: hypothetical protein QM737_22665 [Ferruginibacter sp.]